MQNVQFQAPQAATFQFPPADPGCKPLAPGETPVCKLERVRKKKKKTSAPKATNDARITR